MRRKMTIRWNLRKVMADQGMFATSDLVPLLAERGVSLSREQVYRLVTQTPERLNMAVLAALCDTLGVGVTELIEVVAEPAAGVQSRRWPGQGHRRSERHQGREGPHAHPSEDRARQAFVSEADDAQLPSLLDAAVVVVAALPDCPAEVAADALVAATSGGLARLVPSRLRAVAAYLDAHSDALVSGGSGCPPDVARLIDALARRGQGGVVAPRCADCGRQRFLRHPVGDDTRICTTCFARRRPLASCARCGRLARLQMHRESGETRCGHCAEAEPSRLRPCGHCRKPARIQNHIGGVPIGSCCYLHPQERCSVCGFGRVVRPWAAGAKATCAACAVEEHPACVHCGLDAPIPPPAWRPAVCAVRRVAPRRVSTAGRSPSRPTGTARPAVHAAIAGQSAAAAAAVGSEPSPGSPPATTRTCAGTAGPDR